MDLWDRIGGLLESLEAWLAALRFQCAHELTDVLGEDSKAREEGEAAWRELQALEALAKKEFRRLHLGMTILRLAGKRWAHIPQTVRLHHEAREAAARVHAARLHFESFWLRIQAACDHLSGADSPLARPGTVGIQSGSAEKEVMPGR